MFEITLGDFRSCELRGLRRGRENFLLTILGTTSPFPDVWPAIKICSEEVEDTLPVLLLPDNNALLLLLHTGDLKVVCLKAVMGILVAEETLGCSCLKEDVEPVDLTTEVFDEIILAREGIVWILHPEIMDRKLEVTTTDLSMGPSLMGAKPNWEDLMIGFVILILLEPSDSLLSCSRNLSRLNIVEALTTVIFFTGGACCDLTSVSTFKFSSPFVCILKCIAYIPSYLKGHIAYIYHIGFRPVEYFWNQL